MSELLAGGTAESSASKNIRDYLFDKLFFPKIVTIDKPGFFYSQTSKIYGRPASKKRQVYNFEVIFSDLMKQTERSIGKEKTIELFYRIGVDISRRTILLAGSKQIPPFMRKNTLSFILQNFKTAGLSLAKETNYEGEEILINGSDNIICRKSKNPSVFKGLLCDMISYIFNQNFHAEFNCRACPSCKIRLYKTAKVAYRPDPEEIQISENYIKRNFSYIRNNPEFNQSIKDMIRFKKAWIDSDGKLQLFGKVIFPAEIGWVGIITKHYQDEGLFRLLAESIVLSSGSIWDRTDVFEKKYSSVSKMMSMLGWGFPYIRKEGKMIYCDFLYPPYSKYGYLHQCLILQGFLEACDKKKLKMTRTSERSDPLSVRVIFSYC